MVGREQIREGVLRAMRQVNRLSLDERPLSEEDSTVLFGNAAVLDSMSFVNFVVALEEEMSHISDRPIDVVGMLNSPEAHQDPICTLGELIESLQHVMQHTPDRI